MDQRTKCKISKYKTCKTKHRTKSLDSERFQKYGTKYMMHGQIKNSPIAVKNFCSLKDTIEKIKRQTTERQYIEYKI